MNTTLETQTVLMPTPDAAPFRTAVKRTLIELGIPTNLAGYRCLICAIQLHHATPDQSITKQLYPEVGHLCAPQISAAQVEKLIRYAIDAAWRSRDEVTWHNYFPQDRKPTNWEFISRIAEVLELC